MVSKGVVFVVDEQEGLARPGRQISTPTKQLIILGSVALLLTIGFIAPISAIVSRRMRASVDADLRHHVNTLRTMISWESYYLRAEARTLASFEDVHDALQTNDAQRLSAIAGTIKASHDLDAIYMVDADGNVVIASTQGSPDPAMVASAGVVQDGLSGLNVSRILVLGDRVWLIGAAPHIGRNGSIDAIFLLTREINHEYLERVSDTLGTEVALTDGRLAISSLSPEEHNRFTATGWLPDVLAVDEQRLQDIRIGDVPYRLLLAPLNPADASPIFAALLQPTQLIEDAIRQTIRWVVVLGGVLISLILVLVQFHVRAIFKPLQALAQASQIIAAGNLDQPLSVQGVAEVQMLATSLEEMRARLKGLLEEQRQWNVELDAQVRARTEELEQLCRLRDRLLAKLIYAQEDERQRVARELHDETSQALANLVVTLGTMARLSDDDKMRRQLEQVKQLAVDTLEGVKRVVLNLRPRLLDDFGLVPAIRWYAEERLGQAGVEFSFEVEGTEMRLPPHTEAGIFRVIQEAVNNIARHAHASRACICMAWEPDMLTVKVEDDGCGFDVEDKMSRAKRNGSLGLVGMQERVALMGGTLAVGSTPGAGVRVLIRVPLSHTVTGYAQDQRSSGR